MDITSTVKTLLDRARIEGPPVDLECVARLQGVGLIQELPLGDLLGSTTSTRNGFIVKINEDMPQKSRFTLAHEIAHTILEGRNPARHAVRMRKPDTHNALEAKCDRIAGELLMPRYMFQPRVNAMPATLDTILRLAETFDASIESTAVRFGQMAPQFARVVVWRLGESTAKVRWASGPAFRTSLERGYEREIAAMPTIKHALTCDHQAVGEERLGSTRTYCESLSLGSGESHYVLSLFKRQIPPAELKGRRMRAHRHCSLMEEAPANGHSPR